MLAHENAGYQRQNARGHVVDEGSVDFIAVFDKPGGYVVLAEAKEDGSAADSSTIWAAGELGHVAHFESGVLANRTLAILGVQILGNLQQDLVQDVNGFFLNCPKDELVQHARRLIRVFACRAPSQLLACESVVSPRVEVYFDLVMNVLSGIRRLVGFEKCVFCFALESNLGQEAAHLCSFFKRQNLRDYMVLSEGAGGTSGFLTTNERKKQGTLKLRTLLQAQKLKIHENCISSKEKLDELKKELLNFTVLVEPSRNPFSNIRSKMTFSGKMHGNDDLIMALLIATLSLELFNSDPKYRQWSSRQIVYTGVHAF